MVGQLACSDTRSSNRLLLAESLRRTSGTGWRTSDGIAILLDRTLLPCMEYVAGMLRRKGLVVRGW